MVDFSRLRLSVVPLKRDLDRFACFPAVETAGYSHPSRHSRDYGVVGNAIAHFPQIGEQLGKASSARAILLRFAFGRHLLFPTIFDNSARIATETSANPAWMVFPPPSPHRPRSS